MRNLKDDLIKLYNIVFMLIINGLNPNQSSIDIETQFLKSGKNRVEPNLFKTK